MTPSTILSSLIFPPPLEGPPAPPLHAASSETTARVEIAGMRFRRIRFSSDGGSDTEILEQFVLAFLDLGVVQRLRDPALGEQVVAVSNSRGKPDLLLDEQHRYPGRLHVAQDVADLAHEHRRQP